MPGFLVPTDAGILSVTPRTRGSYTDRNRSPGDTDYSYRHGLGGLVIGIHMSNVLGVLCIFVCLFFIWGFLVGCCFFLCDAFSTRYLVTNQFVAKILEKTYTQIKPANRHRDKQAFVVYIM